jgi:streptomycin 6-kinase
MFAEYIVKWDLLPDGEPIRTHSSRLLPVRQHGVAAMLKVAQEPEEKFGAQLMVWWDGDGAARVLAHDQDALLLERATVRRTTTPSTFSAPLPHASTHRETHPLLN